MSSVNVEVPDDRPTPNALEFERRLLGALLLHPEIIAKFRALGLRPDQLWGLVPSAVEIQRRLG